MKKIGIVLGGLTLLLSACSSTEGQLKEISIQENQPTYVLEDVSSKEKPLEDIIVFDEAGVIIKKDGSNLILSMPVNILFDFDSYKVKENVKNSLDILGKALKENPDIKLKIDGYTDIIGSDQYNLNLSIKRAVAIKNYLIYRGAFDSNITIEGYGKQNPIATNSTDEGRTKNRRVEFIISRNKVNF